MGVTPKGLKSFTEFWPYYVLEHTHPGNRQCHTIGTSLVFVVMAVALWSHDASWLWGAPIFGYGFAWIGHFFIQKNRPATFTYPFWSLVGDFRMFFLTLAFRMPDEIMRAQRAVGQQKESALVS